jgi:hypothetical protein
MYVLAINEIPMHDTTTEISDVIDDILDRTPEEAHSVLGGFAFLFGKLTNEDQHDDLSLQAPDHATSHVVMAISMLDDTPMDETTRQSCAVLPSICSIRPPGSYGTMPFIFWTGYVRSSPPSTMERISFPTSV